MRPPVSLEHIRQIKMRVKMYDPHLLIRPQRPAERAHQWDAHTVIAADEQRKRVIKRYPRRRLHLAEVPLPIQIALDVAIITHAQPADQLALLGAGRDERGDRPDAARRKRRTFPIARRAVKWNAQQSNLRIG